MDRAFFQKRAFVDVNGSDWADGGSDIQGPRFPVNAVAGVALSQVLGQSGQCADLTVLKAITYALPSAGDLDANPPNDVDGRYRGAVATHAPGFGLVSARRFGDIAPGIGQHNLHLGRDWRRLRQ